jgi:hypothetical protein
MSARPQKQERPGATATAHGAAGRTRACSASTRPKASRTRTLPQITVAEPETDRRWRFAGREAQTLRELIRRGPAGTTSGELSPMGWARRSSSYVFKLRAAGLDIATVREPAGDAWVGRYVLHTRLVVLGEPPARGEAQ